MNKVPLGVIPKNENKGDEMVEIIERHHQYVPTKSQINQQLLSTGVIATVCDANFHKILMGGDLLTAARGRGAQAIRMNGGNAISRLEGLQMFALDWHTKMNMLEVRNYCSIVIYTFQYI